MGLYSAGDFYTPDPEVNPLIVLVAARRDYVTFLYASKGHGAYFSNM